MKWMVEIKNYGRDQWEEWSTQCKKASFLCALRLAMQEQIEHYLTSFRLRNLETGDTLSVKELLETELRFRYKEIHYVEVRHH